MNRVLFVILGVLLTGVLACQVVYGEPADQESRLIDKYGEWKCLTNLCVTVNPGDKKISIKRLESDGWTLQTAADWRAERGWFVFAENAERVWIYSGDSLRLLLFTPRIGSAIYVKEYPVPIPNSVKSKLGAKL
jgi:hypothetical protein